MIAFKIATEKPNDYTALGLIGNNIHVHYWVIESIMRVAVHVTEIVAR